MTNYKFLVTGRDGLIGSSFVRLLKRNNLEFLALSRKDLNLLNFSKVIDFFRNYISR